MRTSRLRSGVAGINTSTSVAPIKFPSRKIQGNELKKANASDRLKMYSASLSSAAGNAPPGKKLEYFETKGDTEMDWREG